MPRKKKTAQASGDPIFSSLFTLIAQKGWFDLTLPQIARALKTPLPELLKTYPDKNALLAAFLGQIDRTVAGSSLDGAGASLKERLFEILMLRFEAMQPYRAGLTKLLDEALGSPLSGICLAVEMAPQAARSARLMLELAGYPVRKPLSELTIGGLKLVYLQALRTWKNDASADLSATMASVDRGLDRLISILRLPE
jgi:AcrR family transcriptional regulator